MDAVGHVVLDNQITIFLAGTATRVRTLETVPGIILKTIDIVVFHIHRLSRIV